MKKINLIYLSFLSLSLVGCGGGSSSNSSFFEITNKSIENISVVEGMKKAIILTTNRNDVEFKIVNKDQNTNIELKPKVGLLTYRTNLSVGSSESVTIKAIDSNGKESKAVNLIFKTVSSNITPSREILSTGVSSDVGGKSRDFSSVNGYITDPFGNVWENTLKGKALESKLYIAAKNRCELLHSINKNSNWRTPTVDELLNLINYSKVSGGSMLDSPFEKSNLILWAESEQGRYSVVSQATGMVNEVKLLDKYPIRCINAPKKYLQEHVISTSRATDVTYDFSTGLKWSPMTQESYRKIIDINQSATDYCASYENASGWKLPNINEVRSIVNNGTIEPSILRGNNVIFSSTTFNNKNQNAKKAYYYLGLEHDKIVISISPDIDIPYPITCVKKIEN